MLLAHSQLCFDHSKNILILRLYFHTLKCISETCLRNIVSAFFIESWGFENGKKFYFCFSLFLYKLFSSDCYCRVIYSCMNILPQFVSFHLCSRILSVQCVFFVIITILYCIFALLLQRLIIYIIPTYYLFYIRLKFYIYSLSSII